MWTGKTELQTLMLIAIKDGRTPYLMDRTNRITDVNDDIYLISIEDGHQKRWKGRTELQTSVLTNIIYRMTVVNRLSGNIFWTKSSQ